MLAKRVIPCLDIKDGRVVKGVKFNNLRDAADPIEAARIYNDCGADELAFLDIAASSEKRRTVYDLVEKTAREVFIPLTVGGGVRTIDDVRRLLLSGADKVAINTAAVLDPDLIGEAAAMFGSQCVVAAVDAKRSLSGWEVMIAAGCRPTGIDAVAWAREAARRGAGEILLTSVDRDGTGRGFDIELTRMVAGSVSVPVIASGGGAAPGHFYEALTEGGADAVLAATVFHYSRLSIRTLKSYLKEKGVPVRWS